MFHQEESSNPPQKGNVIFMGDSLLDDFLCLEDKSKDLTREMEHLGFTVDNYAVDGSKLKDLILGIEPREVCRTARSYKYPVNEDGKVYQLELLSRKSTRPFQPVYQSDVTNSDMVVISAGGNDLQVDVMRILFGVEYFFNSVVSGEFISDYERIIEKSKEEGRKVVVVCMYLPYLGKGSTYGTFESLAVSIVDKWREFIVPLAKKHNIAVLDLSRTLDSKVRENYGTSDVQTSNSTNKCIARCLEYIYKNYNGFGVYFAPDCDVNNIKTSE